MLQVHAAGNLSETETLRSSCRSSSRHYDTIWDNRTIWVHSQLFTATLSAQTVTNSYWHYFDIRESDHLSLSDVWWFLSFHIPGYARNKCEVLSRVKWYKSHETPPLGQYLELGKGMFGMDRGSTVHAKTSQRHDKGFLCLTWLVIFWYFLHECLCPPHAYKMLQNCFVHISSNAQKMQFTFHLLYQPVFLQPPVFLVDLGSSCHPWIYWYFSTVIFATRSRRD